MLMGITTPFPSRFCLSLQTFGHNMLKLQQLIAHAHILQPTTYTEISLVDFTSKRQYWRMHYDNTYPNQSSSPMAMLRYFYTLGELCMVAWNFSSLPLLNMVEKRIFTLLTLYTCNFCSTANPHSNLIAKTYRSRPPLPWGKRPASSWLYATVCIGSIFV